MHALVRQPRKLLSFQPTPEDWAVLGPLPPEEKTRILWLLAQFRVIARAAGQCAACRSIADAAGVAFNTIYEPWKRYRETADLRVLIDRRRNPDLWLRANPGESGLPAPFLSFWCSLCDQNQRAFKAAHKALVRRYQQWLAGDQSQAIPGYASCPSPDQRTGLPSGWTYRNLMLHVPKDVETAATRHGRFAAKKLSGTIRTTRVGCWPLREVQFDDAWHDILVAVPGSNSLCRVLEFGAVDQYTTYIFRPGLKPRVKDLSTGRAQALAERDFHLWHVNWLLDWGVHPHGTLFQAERGTARFTPEYAERLLGVYGDLVTFGTGGMSGAPAHAGAYRERAHGNPNAKALKESSGKLIHNDLADLPGQAGMNRDDCPLSLHGRTREAETLIDLAAAVPALRGKLRLGVLDLAEFVFAVNTRYDLINARIDHDIEGWAECGFIIEEYRVTSAGDLWHPLARLADHERELLTIALRHDPGLMRRRRLSPAEALRLSLSGVNLRKPPRESVPFLLGPEYGQIIAPRDGRFHLRRPEFGDRPLRFHSTYQDSGGMRRRIDNGTETLVHLNPWKPEFIYLSDARRQTFLGIAERDHAVCRADEEARLRAHGEAERDYKDSVRELSVRQGLARVRNLKQNTAAIRSAARPSARDAALATAGLVPESMLDVPEPEIIPDPSAAFDPADLVPDTAALLD